MTVLLDMKRLDYGLYQWPALSIFTRSIMEFANCSTDTLLVVSDILSAIEGQKLITSSRLMLCQMGRMSV